MIVEGLIFVAVWWAIGFMFAMWLTDRPILWKDVAIAATLGGFIGPVLVVLVLGVTFAIVIYRMEFWQRPVFKKRGELPADYTPNICTPCFEQSVAKSGQLVAEVIAFLDLLAGKR